MSHSLSVAELAMADTYWINFSQRMFFSVDIASLMSKSLYAEVAVFSLFIHS